MFFAPDLGIFILITTLLEHGSTKNGLKLRFAEVDFLMNAPYFHLGTTVSSVGPQDGRKYVLSLSAAVH